MPPPADQADELVDSFDYELPPKLIAQRPAEPRDQARLMAIDRRTRTIAHHRFADLPRLLQPGDLLVANRTLVLPARLRGQRAGSSGRCELLLLRALSPTSWAALVRPGRRLRPGARVLLDGLDEPREVEIGEQLPEGARVVHFGSPELAARLLAAGEMPLPPYIRGWQGPPERYQTVYGDLPGSAAAPTAGLHFTPRLLAELESAGIGFEMVTLHVGLDTFRPMRSDRVAEHEMHAEWAKVSAATLERIDQARASGGRVVAVGTTSVRALESAACCAEGRDWSGWTRLFIKSGHRFRMLDAMITNFHLPRSTLLVLVSAFAGRELVLRAYRTAVRERYRFYSFGDAMILL